MLSLRPILSKVPPPARVVVAIFGAFLAGYTAWAVSGVGSEHFRTVVSDIAPLPLGLAGTVLAVLAGRRPGLSAATSKGWHRIALAFGAWWLGDVLWCVEEVLLHKDPFPSLADAGYLAFYPLLAWGLMSLAQRPGEREERSRVTLDALTVILAAGMGVWYLVVGPTVHGQGGAGVAATVLNVLYPVGDLALVFGLAVVLLRRSADQTVVRLMLGGVGLFVVADLAYARLSLSDSYSPGGWPDVAWEVAQFVFLVAAAVQLGGRDGEKAGPVAAPAVLRVSRLPYAAVAAAYGLLLLVGNTHATYPLNGLLLGAVAITTLVVIRQIHVLDENVRLLAEVSDLAATDGLTGLRTRRSFEESGERLAGSGRTVSVLMVDVDHFKTINDTYGHAAGDRVLADVAANSRRQLRAGDIIGRYGGDELVIALADCPLAQAVDVADRISRAVAGEPVITEDGVVTVGLSIGVAQSVSGDDLDALLARADSALYAAKRAGRGCVRVNSGLQL